VTSKDASESLYGNSTSNNLNPDSVDHVCDPCPHLLSEQTENLDRVNHPAHYTQGGIECIEAIKSAVGVDGFAAYLQGNILKYLWRYQHKEHPVEDLKKAQWYLTRLISEIEND